MDKQFNDTGLCIPQRHYMVDMSAKLEQIIRLVDRESYFTINRPRQFGKTTTLFLLSQTLNQRPDYIALKLSFEGIDSESNQHSATFISVFMDMLRHECEFLGLTDLAHFISEQTASTTTLPQLSQFITKLKRDFVPQKSLVLLIDEVDKSSNNQLFLDFLAMLRSKYLHQNEGRDHSFQAVILAGVHDIKTLKPKFRPDDTADPFDKLRTSYNSPWNIAVDFKVDLSFSPPEIETMLQDYTAHTGTTMNHSAIAERLHHYTAGYPYLVSKLCKFIEEDILPAQSDQNWSLADVETAFKMIVDGRYTTTLFDSLTKNLENNPDLYEYIFHILINGKQYPFTISDPVVNLAHLYGILVPSEQGHCKIHNRIFEQKIYDYMLSKFLRTDLGRINGFGGPEFYNEDGLDVPLVLRRFQAFMKEHYSHVDMQFLEREGRLLFLAYLKPIVNGRGFEFKEPVVANERRLDIVITYGKQRYVLELKRWYGEQYHQAGLQQLSDYLDIYGLKTGYLLIYDFNKSKTYREEWLDFQDKRIFAVWV